MIIITGSITGTPDTISELIAATTTSAVHLEMRDAYTPVWSLRW